MALSEVAVLEIALAESQREQARLMEWNDRITGRKEYESWCEFKTKLTECEKKLAESERISGILREQRNVAEDKVKELSAESAANYEAAAKWKEQALDQQARANDFEVEVTELKRVVDQYRESHKTKVL